MFSIAAMNIGTQKLLEYSLYDRAQKICNNQSSNINEVIKAFLNFLFFYEKIWHTLKALKSAKSTKSTKSTKRHKGTQAKAQKRK